MSYISENTNLKDKKIKNSGNTCFANATMQVILSIPQLVDFYLEYTGNETTSIVLKEFILQYQNTEKNDSMETHHLYSNLLSQKNIFDGNQQDAHEFFIQLIEQLYLDLGGDIKPITTEYAFMNVKMNNFIMNMFYGLMRSDIICCKCRIRSIMFEEISTLSLAVFSSLNDSLKDFFKIETIERNCKCGCVESKKTKFLTNHPDILTIHISRFHSNKSKNTDSVSIEMNVTLDSVKYDLFGCVMHFGNYGSSGHYTSFAKRGDWLLYDDENIQKVFPKSPSKTAYLLFYRKKNK